MALIAGNHLLTEELLLVVFDQCQSLLLSQSIGVWQALNLLTLMKIAVCYRQKYLFGPLQSQQRLSSRVFHFQFFHCHQLATNSLTLIK